jgi:DNA-binding CsgD family transcriptional regulator
MESLRSRDLRAALEFVEAAWALADEHAFTLQTLAALGELIPSDVLAYNELDRVHRRSLVYVGTDEGDDDDDPELFWRIVDEHPLCRHQQAYADFSASRLSDVISRPRLMNSRVYAEWFRPAGVEAELEIGIAHSRTLTREADILELVGAGLTNAAIAERLWISPGTVKKHLENIYAKLGVGNRTAAVAWTSRPANKYPAP